MKKKYRMYGFVPYNISEIQKGIQFGHAVVEYALKFGNTQEYLDWANDDKTFIILNGGTTNKRFNFDDGKPFGSINQHLLFVDQLLDGKVMYFFEPDLGDQLTAFCFLVEDRIWDRVTYPSPGDVELDPFEVAWYDNLSDDEYNQIFGLREFLSKFKLA